MKSFKGGYTKDQVDAIEAHKKGQEMAEKGQEMAENARETAKIMLELANGKVEDIKNVTEEQIKVALEEKKNMELKIQEIMNNEELKAKITENVDKFKETLNDLSEKGVEFAMKKLEQGKAAADYASEKANETYGKVFSKDNKEKVRQGMEDVTNFASAKTSEGIDRLKNIADSKEVSDAKEKARQGMKDVSDKLNKTANLVGNYASGLFGTKKNLPPGTNVDGTKGGKRKNKTKKLTKKEKKMKKARK